MPEEDEFQKTATTMTISHLAAFALGVLFMWTYGETPAPETFPVPGEKPDPEIMLLKIPVPHRVQL